MAWFAAHILVYFRCKDGEQTAFDLWENIVLIQAETVAETMAKAHKHGKEAEGDSGGTLTSFGKPSEMAFAGVRKLMIISDSGKRPEDGAEITFSTFTVQTQDHINRLVRDETVRVIYQSSGADE